MLAAMVARGGSEANTRIMIGSACRTRSSPATTGARLRGHPMFGVFASVPFHEVAAFVEAGE